MRIFLAQQVVGMAAQVAAALPLLLITILLAHTLGLEQAGKFSIALGLSAFLFAPASWGFRTHIILDRFKLFSASQYAAGRMLAVTAAGALTLILSGIMEVPIVLSVAVVLFRACDSLIDLDLAFNQVRRTNQTALNRFALAHFAKLVTLMLIGGVGLLVDKAHSNFFALMAGALVSATAMAIVLADVARIPSYRITPANIASLFFHTRWYGSAEIASAATVSTPRISLGWLYTGAALGVAGTTLSVVGFFGMAFYTTWMRFLPAYSANLQKAKAVRWFVFEVIFLVLGIGLASWLILPAMTAIVFGFRGADNLSLSREILLASTFFFGCMTLPNLYKITSKPWMEAATYVLSIAVAGGTAWYFPSFRQTPLLVSVMATVMLAMSLPLALRLMMRQPPKAEDISGMIAVFARTTNRPPPRVARMMRVATDLGYQCIFLGAQRDENLPRQEVVDGWDIRRIGRPFPVLNGTRAVSYLISIYHFNRDLFRTLVLMKPTLVHASDYRTMPAAILYRIFCPTRLLFNIHDNIATSHNVPGVVRVLLNALEGVFVLCADVALVPEVFRRTMLPRWCRHKVIVIRNTPIDPGFAPPPEITDRIRIFYGGWIDWERGLRQLIELAKKNVDMIELRIAGEGSKDIVQELQSTSEIVFLGALSYKNSIEETKFCHFVAGCYDLSRIINRFAASNKIAEALAVGRPILLNSELEIAKHLQPFGCVISMPYSEIPQAGDRITALIGDREAYLSACASSRAVYEAEYAWENARETIQDVILGRSATIDLSSPENPEPSGGHRK